MQGLRGASLTSTAYDRVTETEAAILDEDIVKYRLLCYCYSSLLQVKMLNTDVLNLLYAFSQIIWPK